ncbi:N-(5'-phosphoribosyl)anthranilate isomerase [Spirochaetia bacterium]|nr:N-(5'-phosphoribosyl)anthranilate isomerase [Spirochaetia bacterium]GHV73420.1 N-(5'-phosphoribosyl)anthranilate isomerase [Spirochaetia bacterium]
MSKIKICGLFRDDDISFANEAGPDYAGFVFALSKRQVSPKQAAHLRTWLRYDIVPVGVFVNAPVGEIAALYRDGVIGIAQLHGDEDSNYIAVLKEQTAANTSGPIPVIKAVRVESREDILGAAGVEADYRLLDNGAGGTGKRFDWTLLRDGEFLGGLPVPCFLAGGIDVYTMEEALLFKPFGIDVSSGAETGGRKDRDKMLRLVEMVRNWK